MTTNHNAAADLLITGVTVIDGTGAAPLTNTDLLVRDGVIAAIGEGTAHEHGVPTVDGAGGFLIPGLWDTHVHLLHGSGGWVFPEENSPAQGEVNARTALRNGVTTVVDVGGPQDELLAIRERVRTGDLIGPHLLLTGHCFTAPGGHPAATIWGGDEHGHVTLQTATPQTARDEVRSLATEIGVAAIKIHYTAGLGPWPVLPRISDEVVTAIVDQAHQHGLTVIAHVDRARDAIDVLRLGVDGVEHMYIPQPDTAEQDLAQVIELALARGAYWSMTLVVFEAWGRAGDRAYLERFDTNGNVDPKIIASLTTDGNMWQSIKGEVSDEFARRYECGRAALPLMNAAGVKTSVGTDAGASATFHGLAVHRELEIMQEVGIAPARILQAATRLAAEKFSLGGEIGTVSVGKRADLVLLAEDPLADIRNTRLIRSIVKSGVIHTPAELAVGGATLSAART